MEFLTNNSGLLVLFFQFLFLVSFAISQFSLFSWMKTMMSWQKSQDEYTSKLFSYIQSDRQLMIDYFTKHAEHLEEQHRNQMKLIEILGKLKS